MSYVRLYLPSSAESIHYDCLHSFNGRKASHRQYRDNDSGLLPSQAHVLARWKVKFSSPLRRDVLTTQALNNAKGDSFLPGTKATGASKCSFISI